FGRSVDSFFFGIGMHSAPGPRILSIASLSHFVPMTRASQARLSQPDPLLDSIRNLPDGRPPPSALRSCTGNYPMPVTTGAGVHGDLTVDNFLEGLDALDPLTIVATGVQSLWEEYVVPPGDDYYQQAGRGGKFGGKFGGKGGKGGKRNRSG